MPCGPTCPLPSVAASICAFTASRLKLAPFCIGGNSIAVIASFSTCCWTNTKRQNSYLNQSKYCCAPSLVPLFGPARALERIEAKVGQVGHVDLGLFAEPAAGLVDEAILVVVDAHRTERAFAEVEDFVPVRRTLAGDHVHLVVAVQMHLVGRSPICLPFFSSSAMFGLPAAATKRREPVEPGDDAVLDLARRHLARPADHRRHAEAAFHDRALALRERRLSAVRPGEDLGAVVGGEDDDGVVVDAHVLELLHHEADVVVELRHAGFVDATSRSSSCASPGTSATGA